MDVEAAPVEASSRVSLLEVPPTRAHVRVAHGRVGGAAFGGAEEKSAGGGRTFGVWTRLFRKGGAHPCTEVFRRGWGRKTISTFTRIVRGGKLSGNSV